MGEGKPAHSLGPSPIPPDSHGVKNRVPKAPPPVVGFCVDALPWRSGVPFFTEYNLKATASCRAAALGLRCCFMFHKHHDPGSSCLAVCCWGDTFLVVEVSCCLSK